MTSRTKYWRSLEELSGTAEFERWLHAEFPAAAAEWGSEIHRRDFLRLMGASLALAGLGACTKQPIEKIVPYVKQPEELIPGKALRFATATTFAGYAQGIVVTSREGRPIKIEGNPDHPASLGATTIWAQAAVLDLYDPDRAQVVMKGETISTSARFLEELDNALAGQDPIGGEGLAILTETVTSPTVAAQMKAISQRFPKSWWYQWDPISRDALRDGRAGGEFGGETTYDFKKSRVVVALDSDFLFTHPAALRHGRDFASSRRVIDVDGARMSRLYVAEPTPSITGSNADHRLPVAAADIGAIAVELAVLVGALPRTADLPSQPGPHTSWLRGAANDLARNRGTGVIIAGEGQRGEVHALVAKINAALGNEGTTIFYSDKVEACPMAQTVGLARLTNEIKGGRVNALFILGGNPAYNAPVDLGFADALQNVNFCVHHSLHRNETSRLCHWHIPAAHFLEEWSDVRAHDGTVSIIQPLIEPIYEGMSRHELLNSLVRQPAQSSYDIVRNNWFRSNPSF
ncbi:MAG: molybdopterin oxidoreductase, iron-sulfur binding subunit [Spartobacteria bacterium]|nr:molybdopterin oxidoreductase, iron-sulfur binding subunit [Spartobacteria bacterium]